MPDEATHECQEEYKECVAAHKARVDVALKTADPWETAEQLAKKAGVTTRTIERAKAAAMLQNPTGVGFCNNPPAAPMKLRDLYERDKATLVSLGFRPNTSAAESALSRCSRLEQAYFICEIVPEFKRDLQHWLSRRKQRGRKYRYTEGVEAKAAEENNAAHEAD